MKEELAKLLGVPPDAPHLDEAMTHPSYANEQGLTRHNQRLEFLGDAVLELCVTEFIFERFPEADEGLLTRIRSQMVNTDALADWAREQALEEALLLGRGAEGSNLRSSNNVLADFVEALIAVAYLDGGYEAARAVCASLVEPRLDSLSTHRASMDPKTELQQKVQALGGPAPTYEVVDSGGPPHDRWFKVRVRIGEGWGAEGEGRSKRMAERQAAAQTLDSEEWLAQLGAARSQVDASPESREAAESEPASSGVGKEE